MTPRAYSTSPDKPLATLELRRRFPVAPERVYAAWTQPDELRAWSCPPGYVLAEVQIDLRVGGTHRLVMRHAEKGIVHIATGAYREIVPNRRLAYTWSWVGPEDGDIGETLITVEFRADAERAGGCIVDFTHALLPEDAVSDHNKGWSGCFTKLETLLSAA